MPKINADELDLTDRVVRINRVAKVMKGGRKFSFSALVVVGDGAGHVGAGLGKAGEVQEAIRKGTEKAKKNLMAIPIVNGTIPHEVFGKFGAARVIFKPASPGTGVIAGGPIRAILEIAGVANVLTKSLGSNNAKNMVSASLDAFSRLKNPGDMGKRKGRGSADLELEEGVA